MRYAIFLLAASFVATTQAGELKLEFYGNGLSGKVVMVDLFNEKSTFMVENKSYRAIQVKGTSDRFGVVIPDLPAGRYAVAAYVDTNSNSKLDTNFTGAPTEPYGFSRDARGMFGPPSFDEAAFEVGNSSVTQSIRLH